ncbi:uncharacterized protein LOC125041958 [Penaeus chinensis]|uniref:uncharacterized protein LOC125041958 n=1 Tax=Penaeus chinensis TaxID=139456 RepID=UPI001FB7B8BB|nr:uncharacterized protein LOC125041958 [Penaeus chinensis]
MAVLRRFGRQNFNIILIILGLLFLWFYWFRSPLRTPEKLVKQNLNKIASQRQRGDHRIKEMFTIARCQCTRYKTDIANLRKSRLERLVTDSNTAKSTCSDFATLRGPGQKVVSYSYYFFEGACNAERDQHFTIYLSQMRGTVSSIKKHYPGWLVRIYHNVTLDDKKSSEELCRLYCDHDNVDLCHVHNLPELGNLTNKGVFGRFWRFSVMGDPTVDVFLSRDTDSWVLAREAKAVKAWLRSGLTYHVIHDHPKHKPIIMSGLWGAFNKAQEYLQQVRDFMFEWRVSDKPSHDNEMLRILLWPIMKEDVLNHDSFTCSDPNHGASVPFPTRRVGNEYCGWGLSKAVPALEVNTTECPYECRPDDHKDWVSC